MPLFDIQCIECKTIHPDFILKQYSDYVCLDYKQCGENGCTCSAYEVMFPLTNMQPDNMWSGVTNQHGNFTSKSYYKRYLKQRNLERVDNSIIEEVSKKQRARKDPKNLEEKISKRVTKYLEKEVIPSI